MWIIYLLSITFFIITIILNIYYKRIVGAAGEMWVRKELKKLNQDDYKVINDLLIKTSDGKTHQIDHIVISKYGIFVIETKQYNGYIKGTDYDKNWSIKCGKNRYYIKNPIHQNYGHLKSLSEVLKIPLEEFISIVCISSNAKLNITSNIAIPIYLLISKIKSYTTLKNIEVDKIYTKLNVININNKLEKKKHIEGIKEKQAKYKQSSLNKCPLCGADLVKKKSKYGSFIGCSNYPKCLYTRKN